MDSDNILGGSVGNDDSTKANRGGVAGGSATNLNALAMGASGARAPSATNPFGESAAGLGASGAIAGRQATMQPQIPIMDHHAGTGG